MKVVCTKETLLKDLTKIMSAVRARPAEPILENLLFEVVDGKIILSYTDRELFIECSTAGEVVEGGAIAISAKKFTDIIKKLTQETIEITADEKNNEMTITAGGSKISLKGVSKKEYPTISDFSKANIFTISKNNFISILKKTIFAASKEETQKKILTGLYFVVKDGKLTIAATCGRRLTVAVSEGIDKKVNAKAVIPAKAANITIKLLASSKSKDAVVKVTLSTERYGVEFDNITFTSNLIEGIYPDYERVIPRDNKLNAKINVKETAQAVKQVALMVGKSSMFSQDLVTFTFTKDNLKISAEMKDIGNSQSDIKINYSGEDVEINLRLNYITELLAHIETEFIDFGFNAESRPILASPENDKNYLYIAMPSRK
jgi:DNA polymerase-3 subunit beta